MEKINLFFLHGFLGRPQDWEPVLATMSLEKTHTHLVDYWQMPELNPNIPLSQWGSAFNAYAKRSEGTRNVLVGYSLGGRLALHALEADPQLWSQVILISTNPGFDDAHDGFESKSIERGRRWLQDTYWAENFRGGEWESVLRAWNAQSIFGMDSKTTEAPVKITVETTVELSRCEHDYSREHLGLALTQWSLAQQRNMRRVLKQNIPKLQWIVGEYDGKFLALTRALQSELEKSENLNGRLRTEKIAVKIISGAAHRVPVDQPELLGQALDEMIAGNIGASKKP